MSRNAKLAVAGLVVLALAVVAVVMLRKGDRAPATSAPAAGSARTAKVEGSAAPPPAERQAEMPPMRAPEVVIDRDPEGPLRLEGQVIDEASAPVGGAEVWLSSNPPRSVTTEADGGFAFDKLVGRTYAVSARAGDLVGGPVVATLTATSDPVVVRLRRGATVTVTVADEAGAPVPEIAIELRSAVEQRGTSDAQGKVVFRGVAGWSEVVSAPQRGYAAGSALVVPAVGAPEVSVTLPLRRGAAIRGRVLDEAGKGVADARVQLSDASSGWSTGDSLRDGALTDAKGAFEIAAAAPGSYRLTARAAGFAPGTTELFSVDGRTPTAGRDIRLSRGGSLTGRVVTADGQPAPFATVQVGPALADGGPGGGMGGETRQATADAAGAFSLDGLARARLRARAHTDAAGSTIVEVDLVSVAKVADLTLTLDVTGTIAGVVVDGAGAPVPEVSVIATPDVWSGAKFDPLAFGGSNTALTDGAGRFVLRGLPEGKYRVMAKRDGPGPDMGFGGANAVAAASGATNVRVVLLAPGSLTARLSIEGETAPPVARAHVGWSPGTPLVDGKLSVGELEPGTYDVTFRGPSFGDHVVAGVKIEAGRTTDLGDVRAPRGRRLRGTVLDATGKPVAGAKVMVGEMLFSDGKEFGGSDAAVADLSGLRTAVTGPDGGFVVTGIPSKEAQVAADHGDRGRSTAMAIPVGTDDPPPMTLALRAFGSIAGKVTDKGQPAAGYQVLASPKDAAGMQLAVVMTGADGTFLLERLPSGPIYVQAVKPGMMSMTTEGADVVVEAGKRATVAIDFAGGEVSLVVTVKGLAGAKIDAAQVFLVRGVAAFKSGQEVSDAVTKGGTAVVGMQFAVGASSATFPELAPGGYSVCTVPITGDMNDPVFAQRLQEQASKVAVYCRTVDVAASPKQQAISHEVPAMTPLS